MQEYVLVFCREFWNSKSFLVVHKDRPSWQKGRINLPGGKIDPEDNGCPVVAALRELKEEAGYEATTGFPAGRLEFDGGVVHVVSVLVNRNAQGEPKPRPGETEKVEWTVFPVLREDPRLLPNLRVMIPLLLTGVNGWVVTDNYDSAGVETHGFQISVPTYVQP